MPLTTKNKPPRRTMMNQHRGNPPTNRPIQRPGNMSPSSPYSPDKKTYSSSRNYTNSSVDGRDWKDRSVGNWRAAKLNNSTSRRKRLTPPENQTKKYTRTGTTCEKDIPPPTGAPRPHPTENSLDHAQNSTTRTIPHIKTHTTRNTTPPVSSSKGLDLATSWDGPTYTDTHTNQHAIPTLN